MNQFRERYKVVPQDGDCYMTLFNRRLEQYRRDKVIDEIYSAFFSYQFYRILRSLSIFYDDMTQFLRVNNPEYVIY